MNRLPTSTSETSRPSIKEVLSGEIDNSQPRIDTILSGEDPSLSPEARAAEIRQLNGTFHESSRQTPDYDAFSEIAQLSLSTETADREQYAAKVKELKATGQYEAFYPYEQHVRAIYANPSEQSRQVEETRREIADIYAIPPEARVLPPSANTRPATERPDSFTQHEAVSTPPQQMNDGQQLFNAKNVNISPKTRVKNFFNRFKR